MGGPRARHQEEKVVGTDQPRPRNSQPALLWTSCSVACLFSGCRGFFPDVSRWWKWMQSSAEVVRKCGGDDVTERL
ncbi:hypothetical protein GN956_G21579 [Arapaima gigas]